ncbi:MAG: TIGR00282 family metallophosphoesterase [Acidobacteria bacterium]|nr:TIGR00282 family metallophosphoesterase [Acidobacteriota bacterium]
MRILFIGDIIGRPGRSIVKSRLTEFKNKEHIDFTIANAENLASGFGVTRKTLDELFHSGVDFCTSGNHIWDRKEVLQFIDDEPRLIRPANYPRSVPGHGWTVTETEDYRIGIMNLSGRVFMEPLDNPFLIFDEIIDDVRSKTSIILLDFHAEATSEKIAFGYYVDGRVSAMVGTHTHVQTADECILPGGTAYITDVGMTGGHDSVIGVHKEPIISRFLSMTPSKFAPAEEDLRISYVIIDVDPSTGKAQSITRGQIKNGK